MTIKAKTKKKETRLDRIERMVEESIRSTEAFKEWAQESFKRHQQSREEDKKWARESIERLERSREEDRNGMADLRQMMTNLGNMVGNVGDTLGITAEAWGNQTLAGYLRQEFGISPRIHHRKRLRINGRLREVDLFAQFTSNGNRLTIVCECKARASRQDVEEFAGLLAEMRGRFRDGLVPILFTYAPRKGARAASARRGITLMTPFETWSP